MHKEFPRKECRSCHAPIIWTWTDKGGKAPMDAQPSPAGTFSIGWTTDHPGPHSWYVPADLRNGELLHTNHFATCPDAESYR